MDGGGRRIRLLESTSCLPTGPQIFPAASRDLPSLATQQENYASSFLGKMQRESHFPSPCRRRRGRAGSAVRGRCAAAQVRWTAPDRRGRTPWPWQRCRYRRGTWPPPPPPGRQPTCPHSVPPPPPPLLRGAMGGTAAAATARLRLGKQPRTEGLPLFLLRAKRFLSEQRESRSETCVFVTNMVQ